jgi:hypothetical protein
MEDIQLDFRSRLIDLQLRGSYQLTPFSPHPRHMSDTTRHSATSGDDKDC